MVRVWYLTMELNIRLMGVTLVTLSLRLKLDTDAYVTYNGVEGQNTENTKRLSILVQHFCNAFHL